MAAATAEINTPERPGTTTSYPVAATTKIFAGTLVALNSSGLAVPAADTAGLRVVGRAEATVHNTGSAGDLNVDVKEGVFLYNNSATDAVDANDRGKICFVEDDNTVDETGATHRVVAGRVVDVTSEGVWVDVRAGQAARVPSADTITGAADLAALKTALLALLQAHGIVK
jgi:hypothetical protein